MNNQELLRQIEAIVRDCGQILLTARRDEGYVSEKAGRGNFVTTYDKLVQQTLRERLLALTPQAVFVGEEEELHASVSRGLAYIVDPIDGTANFVRDYHTSAISVGLAENGEMLIGVIYNPYLDELFSALRGGGAFLNGRPIHVSDRPLADGIVVFGTAPYYEELQEESFATAYRYFRRSLDVRRSGSAALDLCSIAAGRFELFFELRLSPWDYAAGSLLVTEAGGSITQMDGSTITLDRPCSILADNSLCRG